MRYGLLDNAYNASHEPIKGFNRHRLNGVEKFNRDEHFIYLRQYDNVTGVESSRPQGGGGGTPDRRSPVYPNNAETIAKLCRNRSFIPPANNSGIRKRIHRFSLASACGTTLVFIIASTIGVYW